MRSIAMATKKYNQLWQEHWKTISSNPTKHKNHENGKKQIIANDEPSF